MVAGIDIGYGYTKMVYRNWIKSNVHVFPSVVSRYIPARSFNETFEIIRVNDRPYLVGYETVTSSRVGPSFVGTDEYFAIIGHCLSKVEVEADIKTIVLGLPPQVFSGERVQLLKDSIRQLDIRCEDGRRVSVPSEVQFVPQGAGILFAYLSENGSPEEIETTTVVVDIGYNTMDVVLFAEGKYRGDMSKSYPHGVSELYDMVRDAYTKKYFIFLSPDRDGLVEHLLKDGSITHMGEKRVIDTQSILDDFFTGRIMTVLDKYMSTVERNGYRVERIILGGGGASYIGKAAGANVVVEPQTANARGFLIYGLN
jgi:hypothetical protein